jgi:two-component sensor histidine kinase
MLIATDITERKETEAQLRKALLEREMLLKEVHHRVKNNMQLVISLLSLQTRYIEDGVATKVLEDTQNRIMTIAMLHEKLYHSENLGRIDCGDYLREIVDHLCGLYDTSQTEVTTCIEGDVQTGTDTAIPCGMIINELVSNALKHGFPQGRAGQVCVDLRCDAAGSYILTVSDNGVGVKEDLDMDNPQSLGLQLVASLVQQIDGTVEIDRGEGTTFKIKFMHHGD